MRRLRLSLAVLGVVVTAAAAAVLWPYAGEAWRLLAAQDDPDALAGLEADGMTGQARAQGLGVIIGQARAAWRGDDAGDFAKTMASLDRNLRRAEEMFGRWAGFDPKPKADATPP